MLWNGRFVAGLRQNDKGVGPRKILHGVEEAGEKPLDCTVQFENEFQFIWLFRNSISIYLRAE